MAPKLQRSRGGTRFTLALLFTWPMTRPSLQHTLRPLAARSTLPPDVPVGAATAVASSRMGRVLLVIAGALVAFALGAGLVFSALRSSARPLPDGPIVVERMRDTARLETLDVSLHEVIHFQPDPARRDSFVGTALEWARYELFPEKGTAVVFAVAHLGFDLSKLEEGRLRIAGDTILVQLPALATQVELLPDQTLVIDSNLTSQQTMQLLDVAKRRFEARLLEDARIRDRARASGERALRALLLTLGFREVLFVERLPSAIAPG